MRKIRVLIVDDSVVIRRLLTDILKEDPDIELAGTAPNGKLALAKLPQLNPDIVTLDIEMPELDGLGTLPELRKTYPKLPVIMFSTLTERGAKATFDALALGATDYVAKPANVGNVSAGIEIVKAQLLPKIKALCPQAIPSAGTTGRMVARPQLPGAERRLPQSCEVVIVGSSTGGPQALASILAGLPAEFPVPIVVVQHMPPVFTKHLADRLNQICTLQVSEATTGEELLPGRVLIAPGGYHLEFERQGLAIRTVLQQGPLENSCRPAVDVTFRSAAKVFGSGCLAAVLTGMGQDGLRGAQDIYLVGGTVLTQDEATSVVWGMPRAVAVAGFSHQSLPLPRIAGELTRMVTALRRRSPLLERIT
ncbi:MAG: chemotaxis response regulator protein-glutamate methylesterase [Pirellulales bacterium]|nr:chemotaxis response regulator protein-glutamate methylesterase [Pirellulales bacterium]